MVRPLDKLEAGDIVMVFAAWTKLPRRAAIDGITLGGNFRIGNHLYNRTGNLRGGDKWGREYIKPWEPRRVRRNHEGS